MTVLPLIPATILMLGWILLLSIAANEDWVNAAIGKVLDNLQEIETLKRKDQSNAKKLSHYQGAAAKLSEGFAAAFFFFCDLSSGYFYPHSFF